MTPDLLGRMQIGHCFRTDGMIVNDEFVGIEETMSKEKE
jgi:hypothetical protein